MEDLKFDEDLIEMPSRETFNEWIRLGEERARKRKRRKIIIATVIALAVIIGIVIWFK